MEVKHFLICSPWPNVIVLPVQDTDFLPILGVLLIAQLVKCTNTKLFDFELQLEKVITGLIRHIVCLTLCRSSSH